ncbi:hypothetical protein ABT336_26130 [Micromonospora sp. NPDC000207]|uniref:hypothetical protein n=1 Tax=Micromonospora sp. NPDC000207 TaxID=3154246 RepID=UPI003332E513
MDLLNSAPADTIRDNCPPDVVRKHIDPLGREGRQELYEDSEVQRLLGPAIEVADNLKREEGIKAQATQRAADGFLYHEESHRNADGFPVSPPYVNPGHAVFPHTMEGTTLSGEPVEVETMKVVHYMNSRGEDAMLARQDRLKALGFEDSVVGKEENEFMAAVGDGRGTSETLLTNRRAEKAQKQEALGAAVAEVSTRIRVADFQRVNVAQARLGSPVPGRAQASATPPKGQTNLPSTSHSPGR